MIRVPVGKVWRAFPELDPYTDEECKSYLREARRRRRWMGLAARLGGLVVGLIGMSLAMAAVGAVISALQRKAPGAPLSGAEFLLVSLLLSTLVLPLLGVLVGRDVWLRRSLRARLRSVACICGYTLLGLTPADEGEGEFVVCPECGTRTFLAHAGLAAGDLLPGAGPSAPSSGPAPRGLVTRRLDPIERRLIGLGVAPAGVPDAVERVRAGLPRARARATLVGVVVGAVILGALIVLLFGGVAAPAEFVRGWVHPPYYAAIGLYLSALAAYLAGLACSGLVRAWCLRRAVARVTRG